MCTIKKNCLAWYLLIILSLIALPLSANQSHLSKFHHLDTIQDYQTYVSHLGIKPTKKIIVVRLSNQTLQLFNQRQLERTYLVSTSKKGAGQKQGTKRTPLGLHHIHQKIGHNEPHYAIFKGRKATGKIWPKSTPRKYHRRDYIVTRVLTLKGLEPGFNQGKNKQNKFVDSNIRNIYLHGTTMEWKLGTPCTIGCIHLSSKDIIDLFNRITAGTQVLILP